MFCLTEGKEGKIKKPTTFRTFLAAGFLLPVSTLYRRWAAVEGSWETTRTLEKNRMFLGVREGPLKVLFPACCGPAQRRAAVWHGKRILDTLVSPQENFANDGGAAQH